MRSSHISTGRGDHELIRKYLRRGHRRIDGLGHGYRTQYENAGPGRCLAHRCHMQGRVYPVYLTHDIHQPTQDRRPNHQPHRISHSTRRHVYPSGWHRLRSPAFYRKVLVMANLTAIKVGTAIVLIAGWVVYILQHVTVVIR